MVQFPELHPGVPLLLLHTELQPPQSLTTFDVTCSQPLATPRSQSPKPELHAVIVQVPVSQLAVAFGGLQP